MDKIINLTCPCCNQKIELVLSESGEVTALFCCDNGIDLGIIPFQQMKGGEKDE